VSKGTWLQEAQLLALWDWLLAGTGVTGRRANHRSVMQGSRLADPGFPDDPGRIA
jgi:hypothetical protein